MTRDLLQIAMLQKPTYTSFCRFRSNVSFQTLLDDLAGQPAFKERRSGTRIAKRLLVTVQPLDEHFKDVGPPLRVTTRDFSSGGIGFIHEDVFPTKWIRVAPFEGCHCFSIAEVRYEHPCPESNGYLIGVQFVENTESDD